jgi:hypothetical protein
MLDDGTYTSSDANGQFHFEKVCDGTHVVQLDLGEPAARHRGDPVHPEHALRGSLVLAVRRRAGRHALAHRLLRAPQDAAEGAAAPPSATPPRRRPAPDPLALRRREIPDDVDRRGRRADWLQEAIRARGGRLAVPARATQSRARPPCASRSATSRRSTSICGSAGERVDPLTFDGVQTSADGQRRGERVARHPARRRRQRAAPPRSSTRAARPCRPIGARVHFANTPARAELVPEQSLLVADGLARPVIAVRFLDRDGAPCAQASRVRSRSTRPTCRSR